METKMKATKILLFSSLAILATAACATKKFTAAQTASDNFALTDEADATERTESCYLSGIDEGAEASCVPAFAFSPSPTAEEADQLFPPVPGSIDDAIGLPEVDVAKAPMTRRRYSKLSNDGRE